MDSEYWVAIIFGIVMLGMIGMGIPSIWNDNEPQYNEPPYAVISALSTKVEVGDNVTFSGIKSRDLDGNITSFEWDFDDGYTASGAIVSHVYFNAGIYNLTLIVTDEGNKISKNTAMVKVVEKPLVIKIVVESEYSWLSYRSGRPSNDIHDEIKSKLEDVNFLEISYDNKNESYNYLLTISYIENKNKNRVYRPCETCIVKEPKYHSYGLTPEKPSDGNEYGTRITCKLRLYDKAHNLLLTKIFYGENSDEALFTRDGAGPRDDALDILTSKEDFINLGEIIASKVTANVVMTSTVTPTVSLTPSPGEKAFTNSIGMEFVQIPAGEFDMGSPSNEAGRDNDEGPVHRVKIANAFYMGKYEVTHKQWREVMGRDRSFFKGDNQAVGSVSWYDAQEFIIKLNEKEGTDKYRLPAEAEWEYAARAGTTTRYSFGDNEFYLSDYALYGIYSSSETNKVGQKKPNPWGLYDMYGNVREWVQDVYYNTYNGAPTDGSAWEGVGSYRVGSAWERVGSYRVVRDGDRNGGAVDFRSAARHRNVPGASDDGYGFRLMRDL